MKVVGTFAFLYFLLFFLAAHTVLLTTGSLAGQIFSFLHMATTGHWPSFAFMTGSPTVTIY